MHQTQFSQKIPYGGFSQIRSHMPGFLRYGHIIGECSSYGQYDCMSVSYTRLWCWLRDTARDVMHASICGNSSFKYDIKNIFHRHAEQDLG